ncbi:MAG: hypothetical protein GC192_17105 [Bacteroidetes bacterium]|nr:hypothetical protein [Bacteroidota bacterium]
MLEQFFRLVSPVKYKTIITKMKRFALIQFISFFFLKMTFSQNAVDSSYFSDCDKYYKSAINYHISGMDCSGFESKIRLKGLLLAVDCYRDNDNIDKGLEILFSKIYAANLLEIGYTKEWFEKIAELCTLKHGKKAIRKQLIKPKFNYYIDEIYSTIDSKQIHEADSTIFVFAATPINYTVELFGKELSILPAKEEFMAEERMLSLKILKSEASPTEIDNFCQKIWQSSELYQELYKYSRN